MFDEDRADGSSQSRTSTSLAVMYTGAATAITHCPPGRKDRDGLAHRNNSSALLSRDHRLIREASPKRKRWVNGRCLHGSGGEWMGFQQKKEENFNKHRFSGSIC